MWILDKFGSAYDLSKMIAISCDNENATFKVKAFTEQSSVSKYFFPIADFDNHAEAKAYIADLVHKLNGGSAHHIGLGELARIKRGLENIFDSLYTPENRDLALHHTKDLINYVETLADYIKGGEHND